MILVSTLVSLDCRNLTLVSLNDQESIDNRRYYVSIDNNALDMCFILRGTDSIYCSALDDVERARS